MKKHLFYTFALLLAFILPMNAALPTASRALQVEILIFSGRPNPVFTVTDPAEIKEIATLVKGLQKNSTAAAKNSADFPALGYRGIAVGNLSVAAPELESFVVNRSDVQVTRKAISQDKSAQSQTAPAASIESSESRLDGSGTLENRLLAMARSRGAIDDAMLRHINSTK